MLAIFCVRLALGLILFLPILWNCLPHARFVRTQFLTALGLTAVAAISAWDEAGGWLRGLMIGGAVVGLAGAIVWTVDPAPLGRTIILAFIAIQAAVLVRLAVTGERSSLGERALNEVTSAALLGAAMTAMLVGHAYLIAPGLSLTPLLRMLRVLFVTVAVRVVIAGTALSLWISAADGHSLTTEVLLWLPVRWLVGVAGPLVFGGMAYSAAKIRSTQSATGILYVAVVCTILGELIGLLLMRQTGLPL
jgi:hypothetical protein